MSIYNTVIINIFDAVCVVILRTLCFGDDILKELCMSYIFADNPTLLTGFWKTDQLSHYSIGQFNFIGPANSYIHTLPIHSAICVYTYLGVYIHTWHVSVHKEWKLQRKILMCLCCCITYVNISVITILNGTFGISRNIILKHWSHCSSLVLLFSHARCTVE